jgi:hypothetical protein
MIQLAPNERIEDANSLIDYNDDKHEYKRKDNGKLMAGISSISGVLPKPFLIQWAASECSNYMLENLEADKTYKQAEIDEMCKLAKTAHRRKSKEACDIGTEIHGHIEDLINGKRVTPSACSSEAVVRAIKEFCKWEEQNKAKWLACEMLVCDMDNDIAGRLDAVADINGERALIDFKTSNSIYPEYHLQTAGYLHCLKYMGREVKHRMILKIPKTDKKKVWHPETRKYTMENNNLEPYIVNTDLEFDTKIFLYAREIYRWANQGALK